MADEFGLNDNSSTQLNYGSSDSSFGIKIKTLDLQTYSVRVNRNMSILNLKEEILSKIGVAIEDQRLLYKGRVLNNDQLLSELNLVEGDSIHLVGRQPVQSQPTLSTLVSDTSRASASEGTGAESSQNTSRIPLDCSTNEACILMDESLSSVPFARMPSLQAVHEIVVTPNALTTISGFIDRMERMLPSSSNSFNTSQHQTIWMNTTTEFLNRGGMPTPENLSFILDRTGQFLRDNTATAISNLSTRLQRADRSSDPVFRGQIQLGAVQLGVSMQELGAMFLELGRVTMCVRMGQTSGESFVNAGRAIYISPEGPNPTMAQLFSSQSSYPSGRNNPAYLRIEQPVPICSASQAQSSANAMQSVATQNFHAVVSSGTPDMANTVLQPPELRNLITHATQMNYTANDGMSIEDLLLDISNDGASDDSEIVEGAEDGKQSDSGENHDSDLAVSRRVEQQFDLGQAVDRIQQNSDPRSIYGALLESSVPPYEEQNVYQDNVELGNNEELADIHGGSETDIRRRLAKE